MHFKKCLDSDAVNGTSWWGQIINMSFDDIVSRLGEPHKTWEPGDKVQYEWNFVDSEGRAVTVYDWKEYNNRRPSEWHVGSRNVTTAKSFVKWFEEAQDGNPA